MSKAKNNVFLALQTNEETRALVEAIQIDNPQAVVSHYPAMVKIDSPGRLVLKRETVEDITGVDFDLQSIHVNLISLTGNIDETEDELILEWKQ
jgi:phenol/toluene 2-monooxygenase (NADH) P2/A2